MQIPTIDIPQILHKLERRDLDNLDAPDAPPIWGQMENVPFIRVRGQAAFWKNESESSYAQRMDDLIASAYGQGLEFQYLIVGQPKETAIFLGMQGQNAEIVLRSSLAAAFPGIILDDQVENSLGNVIEKAGMFAYRGRLTGIPTRKGSERFQSAHRDQKTDKNPIRKPTTLPPTGQQIERVIRGLAGEGWGIWLRATPYPMSNITSDAYSCLDAIAAAASQTKRQLQQLNQTLQQIDPRTQAGSTESISGEIINRQAEYAVSLLESNLQRLDEAKAVGKWEVEVHFFSPKAETLARAQALVRAVFAGPDSVPQPLRVFVCRRTSTPASNFITRLTSNELGTLTQIPSEEVPGYRLTDYARFDTDAEAVIPDKLVKIGAILDGNRKTGHSFAIPLDHFSKHGLVAGMTGSGKTTTIFGMLDRIWNDARKPFLIIEPAKAEYRHLRGAISKDGRGTGPIPELRIYTLGDETVAPLRLNPFEFEIFDTKHRIHVQTHIDYLKSVFNAAFILYAPMPYVLETCLHEIYIDRGWDLTTGMNRRLPESEWDSASKWPIFPTLTDLYQKIDEVTERLGYEERIEMDVKAGLKARIGSLRLGSKGLMLDTKHSVPFSEILSCPTVLELERIGNDDEKAFIIGLFLMRIYEYRRIQASKGKDPEIFKHLVVIEEAHRLLKNIPTEVETEAANTKGQAVETFSNMLAEIRAYGQGVIIAEQIPTKLTPDVIKNTNLKIVHRLVAADDREVLSGAMNMDESQERFIATLPPGVAAIFAEQADHPHLVKIVDFKTDRLSSPVTDENIVKAMSSFTKRELYQPVADYLRFIPVVSGYINTTIRDIAQITMNQSEFSLVWSRLMLNIIRDPALPTDALRPLFQLVMAAIGDIDELVHKDAVKAVLLFSIAQVLHQRGRHYNWSYPQIETLRKDLVIALMALIDGKMETTANSINSFVSQYRQMSTITEGPFAGCVPCKIRCWLRHDAVVAIDPTFRRELIQAMNNARESADLWNELATITQNATHRLVGALAPQDAKAIAICILAQATQRIGWSQHTQRIIVEHVANLLSSQTNDETIMTDTATG